MTTLVQTLNGALMFTSTIVAVSQVFSFCIFLFRLVRPNMIKFAPQGVTQNTFLYPRRYNTGLQLGFIQSHRAQGMICDMDGVVVTPRGATQTPLKRDPRHFTKQP
jgi:hypothetical protein